MDKRQLADFLRSRRTRLQPADVVAARIAAAYTRPAPGGGRAAGRDLSVDYCTRLEQARGPHPSRQVLVGTDRRSGFPSAYLYYLAGEPRGRPAGPPSDIRPGIRHLVNRLEDAAVTVLDATYQVVAWNALATALLGDFSAMAPRDRNLFRRRFLMLDPNAPLHRTSHHVEFGLLAASHLRSAPARYPDDPEIQALIAEALAGRTGFAEIWATHDVEVQRSLTKTMWHPVVGELELDCESWWPSSLSGVIIHSAQPGSPSCQALQLLKVVGTQDMVAPKI
jgi:hypothetical protein